MVLKFAELLSDLAKNLHKAAVLRRLPPANVQPRISLRELPRGRAYGVDGVLSFGMMPQRPAASIHEGQNLWITSQTQRAGGVHVFYTHSNDFQLQKTALAAPASCQICVSVHQAV